MPSWIIYMRYGWFYPMICWRTDTKIMSPWTTICLLIMYNKWIPCCCASPQKYITDDVKMGYEHQWHTRLRLVSFFCIHIWRHLWSITEHTHENMESVSVNWKSDFSVTQKLDSNLPFFCSSDIWCDRHWRRFRREVCWNYGFAGMFLYYGVFNCRLLFNSRYHARLSLWQLRPLFVTRRFSNLSVSGRSLGPGHLFTDST